MASQSKVAAVPRLTSSRRVVVIAPLGWISSVADLERALPAVGRRPVADVASIAGQERFRS